MPRILMLKTKTMHELQATLLALAGAWVGTQRPIAVEVVSSCPSLEVTCDCHSCFSWQAATFLLAALNVILCILVWKGRQPVEKKVATQAIEEDKGEIARQQLEKLRARRNSQ